MEKISGIRAYTNLNSGIKNRSYRYPTKSELQFANGYLLPDSPDLCINEKKQIFTIGSCFAREIESKLIDLGISAPVSNFLLQRDEFIHPAPHMLNEYNVGTILQRIQSAFGQFNYTEDMGIEEVEGGFIDLFLHIHQSPVSIERIHRRRDDIRSIYNELHKSDLVIITLGLVESWFDNKFSCYLNKAPSRKYVLKHPDRFEFHRLGVDDVYLRLEEALVQIFDNTKCAVCLTVSPVPIEATFTNSNAILANYYSKSVLRVAAQLICDKYPRVVYFPSYEIAMSGGSKSFKDDNVHVTHETVETIMGHLLGTKHRINSFESERQFNYIDAEIENRSQ